MIPSPLCPSLLVTEKGEVFRQSGEKPKTAPGGHGYCQVSVKVGVTRRVFLVHRLVAAAYCVGYAPGLVVNHKDGNKLNNSASNLEWVTYAGNTAHAISTGLYRPTGEGSSSAKLRDEDVLNIRKLRSDGVKAGQIAITYGLSLSNVNCILRGHTWKNLPMLSKPDDSHGEKHRSAKLRKEDVLEIREQANSGVPTRTIAERYGISERHAANIKAGKFWKHLQPETKLRQ